MSHRKFEAPRHGSLGFLPRKRTKKHTGHMRAFPKDDASKECHLTAFMGYKAGMTHVMRKMDRPGSVLHKKEVCEAVSIVETPPIVPVAVVGYKATPQGMRTLKSVWAKTLNDEVKRRFYKNWYASKKKAFTKYANDDKFSAKFEEGLEYIAANADTVRVVAHTQPSLVGLRQKTAQIFEIQINGGSISDKVAHAKALLEQQVNVDAVFAEGEYIDILTATKGHGYEGVITRWGVKRLPRKTHRGLRKVACIGAWHPARVGYQVARAGQRGYHHRTERNKRIYRLGKKVAAGEVDITASTASDLTQKGINPMGGFPHYGVVRNDWLMLLGGLPGTKKRPLTLRKAIQAPARFSGDLNLLFIDTSSKYGHGRFQTDAEKRKYLGTLKKDKEE